MASTVEGTAQAQLGPTLDYNFGKRDQPNANDFNRRWEDINRRLAIQEGFVPDYDAALRLFLTDTLNRIDEFLRPAYNELAAIAQLGAIFTITSTSPVPVGLGIKLFNVDPALKAQFAAASYISGRSMSDLTKGVSGTLVSYNRTTGVLALSVNVIAGPDGAVIDDWVFSASADFSAFLNYIDTNVSNLRNELVGGADAYMNTFREVQDRFTAIIGTANASNDSLGELADRITTLIGTATVAADTLGEIEATANANLQKAVDTSVAMAIALG